MSKLVCQRVPQNPQASEQMDQGVPQILEYPQRYFLVHQQVPNYISILTVSGKLIRNQKVYPNYIYPYIGRGVKGTTSRQEYRATDFRPSQKTFIRNSHK